MEIGIYEIVGGVIATFFTALITAFFTRRESKIQIERLQEEVVQMRSQRESNEKSAQVEIMERYTEMYNKMLVDVGQQLDTLKRENGEIRQENVDRRMLSDEMRREIHTLHHELNAVRKELEQMKIDFPCKDCPRRD